MNPIGRLFGILVAAAFLSGLTWLSHAPLALDDAGQATLRLAWRARPERIEQCVERDVESLAAVPSHMRQTVVCDGFNASYLLEVRVDGALVDRAHVEPGGFRRDRPLYVFREIAVAPGRSAVVVTFSRVEEGESDSSRDVLREAVPRDLRWSSALTFAPGRVRVLTYDTARRELVEVAADR